MPPERCVPPNRWQSQAPTAHVCAEADDGSKHLQAHVATTAFDSDDNVDDSKCHPNTRQAVLDDIMNWITIQSAIRIQWILWLNGAAGAGKSVIGRSIVDLCLSQSVPIARFFFFRTDSTRNGLKPVVATLAYQLLESIPELRSIILPKIEADALIFTKSLETQFQTLIFGPLIQLQNESMSKQKTVVLLLDGVDECIGHNEQAKIIRIITNFVKKQAFPIIAFFGSRAENQLRAEFRLLALSDVLLQLQLDTDYQADEDIGRFLNDSFSQIKSTHPFGRELHDKNWPAQADINEIMRKASGQFIYASVVIKFISAANRDPAKLLEIVRGLRPSGNLTPFAQLDALYQHIFSQVADIQATSLVLAWDMFTVTDASFSVGSDPLLGTMDITDIKVALADLTSVLAYTKYRRIQFLHASLPDFLLDPTRSQAYYIDRATWSTQLSILTLRRIISMQPNKIVRTTLPQAAGSDREITRLVNTTSDFVTMMESYLPHAQPTAELRELVTEIRPSLQWQNFTGETSRINYSTSNYQFLQHIVSYIAIIQQWDFGDGIGGRVYREQHKAMEHYVHARFTADLIRQYHHDLYLRVGQAYVLVDRKDISVESDKRGSFWVRLKLRLLYLFHKRFHKP